MQDAAEAQSAHIRRLDGTRLAVADADAFARATLTQHHVTGVQIALINDGALVWSAAYGLRGKNPDLPMQTSSVTWAASITKGLFATYVMQLVESGELDLDAPVRTLLPKPLESYAPYAQKAQHLVNDTLWLRVTPRTLLSHSSGLANFAQLESDGLMRLRFIPGSQYLYSGEGLNLLQFTIEQRKGVSLDTLMQRAILDRAGMTRTGLIYRSEFESDVADRFGSDGQFLAKTRRYPARGAGSMMSTAEDVARFMVALMRGDLLSTETLSQMISPQLPIRSLHQFALDASEPPGEEAERVGLAYGLGWGLLTRTKYGPAFFKEGHGDGAQTYVICFQRTRDCIVLMTNSDNGELAFRPLMERILGNTETPWEWEGYTPEYITRSRRGGR
ncbi:serine hydrolase domain-containing protein [Gemmatimonas sp.]